ncbi:hypothetical protein MOSE0_B02608 [Monosporozyma servazzii]
MLVLEMFRFFAFVYITLTIKLESKHKYLLTFPRLKTYRYQYMYFCIQYQIWGNHNSITTQSETISPSSERVHNTEN